jgi:capsular polysaccharide biosynthesis protein
MGKIYETSQPLYLSRRLLSPKQRLIEEEIKLEEILLKKGVNVQHPQFLALEEQIYLINRHKTIMGCLGSALHSLLFSIKKEKCVIALTPDKVISTFFLIDLLKNNKPYYINCLTPSDSEKENTLPWNCNLCVDLEKAISTMHSLGII